jgi:spore coat polysaccharide biosynthesis protein SpsF
MKTVAIIQARMGSTRLPGKVLMDLAGEPMLARVVNRLRRARTLRDLVIATTTAPADDAIAGLCEARDWACFRGQCDDVLDRYYRASRECGADIVVRVTADCPLIEPTVVDRVVDEFLARQPSIEYACNFLPRRTYPRGLEVEVLRFDVLERIWVKDDNPGWREHVTEYLLHHPELFAIHGVVNGEGWSHLRWTVDTAEDLAFILQIFKHFGHDRFGWEDALDVLRGHPDWLEINRHVKQKEVA